jgi:hypothetical protein
MTDANSMVDKWFEIIGYDEDDDRILLHFDDLRNMATSTNRLLAEMRKKYNSEMLVFCVLRHTVNLHKDVRISVREALSPQFAEFAKFVKEIDKSPLNSNVTEFRKALERFAAKPNLIGKLSDGDICDRIAEVAPLRHLGDECLKSSGLPLRAEMKISRDIVVAQSLGELLLKTAGMPDGMVLGYVVREKENEGFFSLIYKSNGNIISVNDRATEKYFGQFSVLRNDRYTENKAFSMFPYDSVLEISYKESGVHVLVDKAEVKKEHLSFDDFSIDEALRFFVGCLLISARLAGKTYDEKNVRYTTALTRNNLAALESKALINPGNKDIATAYKSLKLEISPKDIMAVPKGRTDCIGRNTSPKLFEEFFSPDMVEFHKDYTDLLPEIQIRYPNEMIKTKEGLQLALLHDIRRNLKRKIQERINAYYHEHGDGVEGINEYRKIVVARKEILFKNLCEKYHLENIERWEKEPYMVYRYSGKERWHETKECLPFNDLSNVVEKDGTGRYYRYGKAYLKDEGGMCNMIFDWEPRHVDDICSMLEIDEDMLPKEIRGYNRNPNCAIGNSLLDITDACQELRNAYTASDNSIYMPFNVVIAMSKKKWNKVFGGKRTDN